ncbi:glycosyltransferase family 1 protein [soil metagenome]
MTYDVLCLSHLRWDFVYQRPQHLLGRCARDHRVFFVEEPIAGEGEARLDVSTRPEGVQVVVPHVPHGLEEREIESVMRALLTGLAREHRLHDPVVWYYTPYALPYALEFDPSAVVYDCMDQLSAFKGAPARLLERELDLFGRADVVFTGGQSLFEEKRRHHPNTHAFPSSIDKQHFERARDAARHDPVDQASIAHPRLGYCGVIDERLDTELLAELAARRPEWQIVMLGPVVKIDEAELPRAPNIHYLGGKDYRDLPDYLAGWDVALLPFARNEATRFISPTKTPEYLAAGKPVVSTSIPDVVRPYGEGDLVRIADSPDEVVAAVEAALAEDATERLARVDRFLAALSWDDTWRRMADLIDDAITTRRRAAYTERSRAVPTVGTSTTRWSIALRKAVGKHV